MNDVQRNRTTAAHNLTVVGVLQRLQCLDSDEDCVGDGQHDPPFREASDESLKVGAVDILHGDERLVLGGIEVHDLDNVGVTEQPCNLGFLDQHVDELLIACMFWMDTLYGEHALESAQPFGSGFKDFGHSTCRNALDDLVLAELISCF